MTINRIIWVFIYLISKNYNRKKISVKRNLKSLKLLSEI